MTFDKTFCASPNCNNKCGRKMTAEQRSRLNGIRKMHGKEFPISYAYFCGEPEKNHEQARPRA
jgi:hypothetical protein